MKTTQYKYSKGDLVWRLKDRKIIESTIDSVTVSIGISQTNRYWFKDCSYTDSELEEYLYDTKKELINFLLTE